MIKKIFATFAALLIAKHSFAQVPLSISGWPHLEIASDAPPLWLGDDPLVGRLSCPPFSRLNLRSQSNEGLFFKQVDVLTGSQGVVWVYKLRTGLFLWDGQSLKGEHAANFFKENIERVVAAKGGGLWELSEYKLKYDQDSLEVTWEKTPPFGPYIFNGISFAISKDSKEAQDLAYQCAGHYKLQMTGQRKELIPSTQYRGQSTRTLVFEDKHSANTELAFEFKMADSIPPNYDVKESELGLRIGKVFSTPWISAIIWNPTRALSSQPRIRQAFTQLTPRGALLREGAQGLGQLQATPIFREHPGAVASLKLRPFSIEQANSALDQLGFKKESGKSSRSVPEKGEFELEIGVIDQHAGLIQKVMHDCFSAAGIRLRFVSLKDLSAKDLQEKKSNLDGILTGIYLPYPEFNFISAFHSKAQKPELFWNLSDEALDAALTQYAVSMTHEKPDFATLRQVYQRLYDLEPITVLMQHKVVLDAKNSKALRLVSDADERDPDWFRHIISG